MAPVVLTARIGNMNTRTEISSVSFVVLLLTGAVVRTALRANTDTATAVISAFGAVLHQLGAAAQIVLIERTRSKFQ